MSNLLDPGIAILKGALADQVCGAAQLAVIHRGTLLGSWAGGRAALAAEFGSPDWSDADPEQASCTPTTSFDWASLTKLLVTTALMRAVEQEQLRLEDPVGSLVTGFVGQRSLWPYEHPLRPGEMIPLDPEVDVDSRVDLEQVTFWHLLTHTSGLPAWQPLYRQPSAAMAKQLAIGTPFADLPGRRITYSDIGFILLGLALEFLHGDPLDQVIREQVLQPLQITQTGYRPLQWQSGPTTIAATEICPWRQRRLVGEVHDENAGRLDGVAGHAGLFGSATDLVTFGQMFLTPDNPLLIPETQAKITQLQYQSGASRRGLGFALRSDIPGSSGYPFSPQAFGHTGFTGTSLWIDPARDLVVALLTNSVFYGRDRDGILSLRVRVHEAITAGIPMV
ncbi:MAG: serine hydrolase [Synechococcaceae cyanobacterium SM2_3_2]|nr:serine hydrolase [Synechococcaceae cyanobacterium SM2_3_2]